jgi:hypothetical protein
MFLIEPIDPTLEDFIHNTFGKEIFDAAGKSIQIREGPYIVNGHTWPSECLVLDEHDNVIDGFCGSPLPWLPWKGKIFIDHLVESRNMEKPNWYDELFSEGWDEEFVDRKHWS